MNPATPTITFSVKIIIAWDTFLSHFSIQVISGFGFTPHQHGKVIWRYSSFTGGGRHQVSLQSVFQVRAGT